MDLELDLWWRSGEFGLVDEQELEDEVWLGRASHQQANTATSVAEGLMARLQAKDPLLTRIGFERLAHCRARPTAL